MRAALLAPLLLALVVLCACSPPQPVVERGEVDGQAVQAVLPAQGVPARALVVYLHGFRGSAADTTEDPHLAEVAEALARDGFAVVSSDAQGDSFGSPAAQHDYAALAALGAERYGTSDTFLLAESMGGLSAVPLVAEGAVPDLRATAAISPALSLLAPSGTPYAGEVVHAWGRQVTAADDPLATAPAALAGQHFRFYVTDGDTTVPTEQHAGAFRSRFGQVADVELVPCTGEHVDASCFRPDDVTAWFDSFLGGR